MILYSYFMDNKIDLFQSKDSRVLIIDKANESVLYWLSFLIEVSPRQINFQITESGFCSISNKMYCDCWIKQKTEKT